MRSQFLWWNILEINNQADSSLSFWTSFAIRTEVLFGLAQNKSTIAGSTITNSIGASAAKNVILSLILLLSLKSLHPKS